MIDENNAFERFHAALEMPTPVGASQRLRAVLLTRGALTSRESATAFPKSRGFAPRLRISLRAAAALLLAAIVVATTGLFLATHRLTTESVPARPLVSPALALAQAGPGPAMVSRTTGWAVGASDVWRTTDGGAHWASVKPRPVSVTDGVIASYFLDAARAWIVEGPDELRIYRTMDGGKTWDVGQPVAALSTRSKPVLFFLDANHGWMLLGALALGNVRSMRQSLFVTQDGGLHWTLEATNPPSSEFLCSSLTAWSGTWVNVAFASTTDGWITVDCNVWVMGGSEFLLASHDGGLTWSPQDLPHARGSDASNCPVMGPEFSGVATCHVGRLVVLDGQNALLLIWSEANVPGLLAITADGGHTWTSRPTPEKTSSISFVDPQHGWATAGQGTTLYRTEDGGLTWTPVQTPAGSRVYKLVDVKGGFAANADGTQLWTTTDNGVTWKVVRPGPSSVCACLP